MKRLAISLCLAATALLWAPARAQTGAVSAAAPGASAPAPPPALVVATQPVVHRIVLSMSNVHLVMAARPVLIDSGSKSDLDALVAGLARHGVKLEQLAAVLLTHGHHDHAGLAAEIRRRSGAVIVAGRAEAPMLHAGHNDDLQPTNFTAAVLKRFAIDPGYEALDADVAVDAPLDLARFGLAGQARQMPGHTPGSLVITLGADRAFVGDMVLGGWLGGAVFATRPGEHYFHADQARNRANLLALLNTPVETFYLGHGGPVTRASVQDWLGVSSH